MRGVATSTIAAIVVSIPCATAAAPALRCDADSMAAQGFDPQRLCRVLDDAAAASLNLHGLLIERHGVPVAERYLSGRDRSVYSLFAHEVDFGPETRHDLRSISKSITSLLWGVAAAEGKAPPLDTRALDLFPELADLNTDGRDAITIRHLLSMTGGLAWDEAGAYDWRNDELALYWRSAQARYVFGRRMAAPAGTRFRYNGGGTAVLAELLARRTGMALPDYAREKLFAPLGIVDWEWLRDPRGRPLAFSGLRMRPRDLAKIGQLILRHGQWNGRQIVPRAWIEASLSPQAEVGDGRRYGYQWWLGATTVPGKAHRWAAAFGNGGQRLFIVPDLDLVVVMTAGAYDDETGAIRINRLFQRIVATLDR